MKTSLLFATSLLLPLGASAQGLINFNTKAGTMLGPPQGAVWVPVYLPEPDPRIIKHGNTATGIPAGTQTYGGGFVMGSGFTAALYGGPVDTSESELSLIATTTFRTQTATTVAGTIVPPAPAQIVPGVPVGGQATLQLRVWENRNGTLTSWNQLTDFSHFENLVLIARGRSDLFVSLPLGDGSEAHPVPNLQGLESFNLNRPIPEPSVWALGFLGAGVAWLCRRHGR